MNYWNKDFVYIQREKCTLHLFNLCKRLNVLDVTI